MSSLQLYDSSTNDTSSLYVRTKKEKWEVKISVGENKQGSSACADVAEPEQEKSSRRDHHWTGHLRVSHHVGGADQETR